MKKKRLICVETDYEPRGYNSFYTINDLPLAEEQKRYVLEWYARKLWEIAEEGIYGDGDYYGKHYDPLVIEGNIAHSYVFDLGDGGRHHPFDTLAELEAALTKDVVTAARDRIEEADGIIKNAFLDEDAVLCLEELGVSYSDARKRLENVLSFEGISDEGYYYVVVDDLGLYATGPTRPVAMASLVNTATDMLVIYDRSDGAMSDALHDVFSERVERIRSVLLGE